jgi:hypothetical protein
MPSCLPSAKGRRALTGSQANSASSSPLLASLSFSSGCPVGRATTHKSGHKLGHFYTDIQKTWAV